MVIILFKINSENNTEENSEFKLKSRIRMSKMRKQDYSPIPPVISKVSPFSSVIVIFPSMNFISDRTLPSSS